MNGNRTSLIALAFAGASIWIVVAARAQDGQAPKDKPTTASAIGNRLNDLVAEIRAEKKLVGLGATIMIDGKVVAAAADGERKKGSGVELEVGDRWHLGSITKSMTATMIARLVEKQEIQWTTTVGECFGASIEMHADCRGVTLEQLLTHTSGAPPNFPIATQFQRPPEGKERVQARKAAVAAILRKEPRSHPGEAYKYSNVGFTIAAAMVEEKTGKSWEDLIRQEVFLPLSITRAGFGPPKDGEKHLDQPRGHQKIGPFKRVAGQEEDNSPIMAPAGWVHMTLADLCIYGNEHLVGERGKGKLLKAETYKRLHTPRLKSYAFGWVVPDQNKWTNGRLIWHNGSNTMWYALLAILPERNAVVSVTSNDGDIESAEEAAFQIVREFSKMK
ncbi:MAG: beta-lactamase family protein [Pirellulaceae bacterium]|nr:beta-lactamase family protein [Pirellulaceae bacterium]